MKRIVLTLSFLLILAATAWSGNFAHTKLVKQNGGSTGDSSTVAPDTSAVKLLDRHWKLIYFVSLADSNAVRYVQVADASDGTFSTVLVDTLVTPSGGAATAARARATADLSAYAGFYCRVILDNLSSAGKALGTTYINWSD